MGRVHEMKTATLPAHIDGILAKRRTSAKSAA